MNGYELSRNWFDWCFENPDKITTNHSALYFFAIEHCNRLGWKTKFGFPTTMAMEAIGIKSYNTYKKVLLELVDYGFIEIIEKSKNQYSANIIALSNIDKALDKALDKAMIKHDTKQSESNIQSIDSIIKHINNKQYNKKQLTKLRDLCDEIINKYDNDQNSDEVDFDKLKEFFNTTCEDMPSIKTITKTRKSAINARIKETSKSDFINVIKLASNSKFLNGENDRGWIADFDWITRPTNYIRILEGNYSNKGNTSNGVQTMEDLKDKLVPLKT